MACSGGHGRQGAQLHLLHRDFKVYVDGAFGRGLRNLRSARQRLGGRRGRAGLVVPLGEVADQAALIVTGVYPVDPRAAARAVPRAGGAEYQYRRTIAPRVVDRHGRAHQTDVGMQAAGDHFVRDLGVTVRHRDRGFLMHAQHHLRRAIAQIIDDAVVQAAITGAGHQRDVGYVQFAQHGGHRVAAPVCFAGYARNRLVMNNRGIGGSVRAIKHYAISKNGRPNVSRTRALSQGLKTRL